MDSMESLQKVQSQQSTARIVGERTNGHLDIWPPFRPKVIPDSWITA